ncbi:MAG: hypothetical protein ABIB79_05030 [archaeon]
METETINVKTQDIKELMADVEMIKAILLSHRPYPDPEGELTDWAKKELEEARKVPDSEMISHEEFEKRLLSK